MRTESLRRAAPHPDTGLDRSWRVQPQPGETLTWDGFYTGPEFIAEDELERLCRRLLGASLAELPALGAAGLGPPRADGAPAPRVLLHSTTPDLNTLQGDLHALRVGQRALDCTTYKEARAPFLARPGDLAVGRTRPWRQACAAHGVEALDVRELDHYYLSHALLRCAERHVEAPVPEMQSLIARFAAAPDTVAAVYALEVELQVFLLWLRAQAGIERLRTDANPAAIGEAWNRKEVLHPSVDEALALRVAGEATGEAWLRAESERSGLTLALGRRFPVFPGYTLERRGRDAADFARQAVDAARLLRTRHGLRLGCLKPSESGDGARITLGVPLEDEARLAELARAGWANGDAYLLEAHVRYAEVEVEGERLLLTPSAHVRARALAPGLTLQFMKGTSWKGNVYLEHTSASGLGLSGERYAELRRTMEGLVEAFRSADQELVTAGVDLGVGALDGPTWGAQPLVGVQDLNISFTGAECLRAYMDRNPDVGGAVTRVVRPAPGVDMSALSRALGELAPSDARPVVVASVPDRWGMFAVCGADPRHAVAEALRCQRALLDRGLLIPF